MMNARFMTKPMIKMLIIVGVLFASIFAYQLLKRHMISKSMQANQAPVVTVSAIKAEYQSWQSLIKATGSLRAVKGVDVTTELAGLVRAIYFVPGATVKAGDLLVQLNIDPDVAQLHVLQAAATLASITYKRDKAQFAVQAVSQATLDTDTATLNSTQAQVEGQMATIAKKTIRAPFTGRLGISLVNPGQYINAGNKVVTLQALDPIWADFYVPEQELAEIAVGQQATIITDSRPDQKFIGKITTINPQVDVATRNVAVEATIPNAKAQLLPGMFADATFTIGKPKRYITLPQTAVSFYPYGEVVYVIKQTSKDQQGKPILTVHQQFVTIGETRGDQIAILKGLQQGDLVVTSGQLKLKNDSQVIINNKIQPSNNSNPILTDK